MLINKLTLGHFGRFHNKEIQFDKGINIIYGQNEAGKSTLHSFIRGMLFGIEKGRGRVAKESLYDKYLPWDAPGSYQGSMELSINNIPYRINRSFYQKEKTFSMARMDTGREVLSNEDTLADIIPNLTESCYNNTISIRQSNAEIDTELAKEVQNYIANLTTAKSSEVNVAEALEELNAKKKEYETAIHSINLKLMEEKIEKCRLNEDMLDRLHIKKTSLKLSLEVIKKQQEQDLSKIKRFTGQELKKLYEIKSWVDEYENLLYSANEYKNRKKEMEAEACKLDDEIKKLNDIKEKLMKSAAIEGEKKSISDEMDEMINFVESEELKASKCKRMMLCGCVSGGIFAVMALLSSFVAGNFILLGVSEISMAFIAALFISALITIVNIRSWKKSRKMIDEHNREINIKDTMVNKLVKEYEGILYTCGGKNHSDVNLINEKSAEARTRKNLIKERCIEIDEEACEMKIRAEELNEKAAGEIKAYINEECINEYTSDFIDAYIEDGDITKLILELMAVDEKVKDDLDFKTKAFEREYAKEAEAAKVIELEIRKFENEKDNLYELMEQYKEDSEKLNKLTKELTAVQLASDTIKKLSTEIHDSFGTQLNQRISKLSEKITLSSYKEVVLNEKLSLKTFNGMKYVDLGRLSTGTIEQFYLALRLSVTELLFEEKMPVILDDGFVNYDNNRLLAAVKLLKELDRQIILFTCQDREQRILDGSGIPYNLVRMDAVS